MSEQAWGTASMDRLVAALAAGFAVLAALLAALGLYGVVSYGVMNRTREFGVRMALGAGPRRIRRLVFGYVGRLTAVGTVAGLAGALALGTLSREMLFGVTGTDPVALTLATLLVAAIAFAAAAVPAQRAARIEPTTALRVD
jgi:ABC-type antimicrobial peptide transport system permease subunit